MGTLDWPAVRMWYNNGQLQREEWAVNIRAPAILIWDADGWLTHELWYVNG